MELNRLLVWMAGISCSLNLLFTFRGSRDVPRSWRLLLVGLLASLAIGLVMIPAWIGYVVGAGWFALIVLPGLIQRLTNSLLVKRRYAAAMTLARLSARLYPFDAWPDHPDIVRAVRWYHEGRTAEATALINDLGRLNTPIGRMAVIMRAQQTGDWEQLLHWLDAQALRTSPRSAQLQMARLQALGELSRPNDMLHAYQSFRDARANSDDEGIGVIAVRVAALSGMTESVDLLTDTLSSALPRDAQEFWRLTARQVSGEPPLDEEFLALQATASPYLTTMIARRISHPLTPLADAELDEAAQDIRTSLAAAVRHEARYAVLQNSSRQRPYATWSIAVLLIGVFVREVPGGTTNAFNLFELGALTIPTSHTPGEWWRMLTAGVLHFGWLHLSMNLVGLMYLGPKLERAWGSTKMLICYITATVGSMGLAPLLISHGLLVGASGGVMGLLGAIIGHLATGWWRGRSRRITRQLGILLLLLSLQTLFDLSTPNVSFACHVLGLSTGLCLSLVQGFLTRREAAV